jgi:hypothetical protein
MAGMRKASFRTAVRVSVGVALFSLFFSACKPTLDIRDIVSNRANPPVPGEWTGAKAILSGAKYAASLAVNADALYVLYYDSTAQKLRIIKSGDMGSTWGTPFTVDNTTGIYSTSNNLIVDGSNLYASYQRSDTVYFIQLTDTGTTFTTSNAQSISNHLSAYPYGYENTLICDTARVYIFYSAAGDPAYSYATKGSSMSFSTPVYIDSALVNSGTNRKEISVCLDTAGNLNVSYFDTLGNPTYLKQATFAYNAALPMTVNFVLAGSPTAVNLSGDFASITALNANFRFISYYDNVNHNLSCYQRYSFTYQPMMIGYVTKTAIVDSSSADIGRNTKIFYSPADGSISICYYDYTNKQLKWARATRRPNTPPTVPPDYPFATQVIDSVGGTNFDLSIGGDGTRMYVLYYDSSSGGSLMLAKSPDGGATW